MKKYTILLFLEGSVKKTSQLKHILNEKKLSFFLEAHSGLSAKIVQEAGFSGVWASGLAISSQFGVRDCNEASWTQVLEVLEFMSDATEIPILVDADTGYGNFNNVRRLIKKLEQRSIAGVCIEDKVFPKTNSFMENSENCLSTIQEYCGKIKAAKDTQQDQDFIVVARTEAYIVGGGIDEVLERCEAYYQAGADAVLVHSKLSTPNQIADFMKYWHKKCPVVIVPTSYYKTPTQVFQDLDIRLILWANHLIRASVFQMQKIAKDIYQEKTVANLDKEIVSMNEIFRLQNFEELSRAENQYLPKLEEELV